MPNPTNDSIVNEHHDGCDTVRYVSHELIRLARAFISVGNHQVSNELQTYAEDLDAALSQLKDSYHDEINRAYQQSRSICGDLLSATLAGAIGTKSSKEPHA